jgi:hypothetical protein
VRSEADDRDGLVAGWPKTSRKGKQRAIALSSSKVRHDLAMATLREGFPFIPPQNAMVIPKPTKVGRKRWQSDATTLYHRGTKNDGFQRSEELTMIALEKL